MSKWRTHGDINFACTTLFLVKTCLFTFESNDSKKSLAIFWHYTHSINGMSQTLMRFGLFSFIIVLTPSHSSHDLWLGLCVLCDWLTKGELYDKAREQNSLLLFLRLVCLLLCWSLSHSRAHAKVFFSTTKKKRTRWWI